MTLRIYQIGTWHERDKNGIESDTMKIVIRLPRTEADKYLLRENDLMRKSMTFTGGFNQVYYYQLSEIKFLEYEDIPRCSKYERIMVYTAKFKKMEMLYADPFDRQLIPKLNEDIEVIP